MLRNGHEAQNKRRLPGPKTMILDDDETFLRFSRLLWMVDSSEDVFNSIVGEILFELAYAFLFPLAFVGVELASTVG